MVTARTESVDKIRWLGLGADDYIGDSATVMVHVNRIREKIEDDPKNPKILETVWGAGYRLNK